MHCANFQYPLKWADIRAIFNQLYGGFTMKKYITILSCVTLSLIAVLTFTIFDKQAFAAGGCSASLAVGNNPQYSTNSITVPKSCGSFTITLKHTGNASRDSKGAHNIVITKIADQRAVGADGIAGGLANAYVKPGDARVIAHSKMIGGGESTSVVFNPASLQAGGNYGFFSSFPGDIALMKGKIILK